MSFALLGSGAVALGTLLAGSPGLTTTTTSAAADEATEIARALGQDSSAPGPNLPSLALPGGIGRISLLDIAAVLDVAASVYSQTDAERAGLQTGEHDPAANGFNLQALELSLAAAVDPYFRFDANLALTLDGIEIEEAYGTTLDLPYGLQLRAGQFLSRFGRLNPTHVHSWDFVDQPFAIGRVFGGDGMRGLGVELSVLLPLPWYVELVASAQNAFGETTNRSFNGAEEPGVDGLEDLAYVAAIKQFFPFSDDLSLSLGLSGAFGPNPSGHLTRTEIYGVDAYLKYRPVADTDATTISLQTEWLYRRRETPEGVLHDLDGYAQLLYRFAQRWAIGARYELGTPTYLPDGAPRPDELDPDWTELRHRASAAVTFTPSEFSRVRLQGAADLPGWREEPIYAVVLALELGVGAHAAHRF